MVNNISAIHVPRTKKRNPADAAKLAATAAIVKAIGSDCGACNIEIINDPKIVEKRSRELIAEYESDMRMMEEKKLLIQI